MKPIPQHRIDLGQHRWNDAWKERSKAGIGAMDFDDEFLTVCSQMMNARDWRDAVRRTLFNLRDKVRP